MPKSDSDYRVRIDLDVPLEKVASAELDLIEAHLGPLLRKVLLEVMDADDELDVDKDQHASGAVRTGIDDKTSG